MSHRRRLRRKQQPVDASLFHTLELARHRTRQLFITDLQLGGNRLGEIANLLPSISLQRRRRRGVVSMGIDDHKSFLCVSILRLRELPIVSCKSPCYTNLLRKKNQRSNF